MNTTEISSIFLKNILLKINKRLDANFDDDDHFYDDLDIDSLDLVEFIANVEQEYQVRIEDHELEKLSSINAIIDFLQKEIQQ